MLNFLLRGLFISTIVILTGVGTGSLINSVILQKATQPTVKLTPATLPSPLVTVTNTPQPIIKVPTINMVSPISVPQENVRIIPYNTDRVFSCPKQNQEEIVNARHDNERIYSQYFECSSKKASESGCSESCQSQPSSYDRTECFGNCTAKSNAECKSQNNYDVTQATLEALINKYCHELF